MFVFLQLCELQSEVHWVVHHTHVSAILYVLLISERCLQDGFDYRQVIDNRPCCMPQAPVLVIHQRNVKVLSCMQRDSRMVLALLALC